MFQIVNKSNLIEKKKNPKDWGEKLFLLNSLFRSDVDIIILLYFLLTVVLYEPLDSAVTVSKQGRDVGICVPALGGCCRGHRARLWAHSHAPRALWESSLWRSRSWSQWTCESTAPSVGWCWNGGRCITGHRVAPAGGCAGDGWEFLSQRKTT